MFPVELFVMIALMSVVGIIVWPNSMCVRVNFRVVFFISVRVFRENASRIAPFPVWVICWVYPYAVFSALLFLFLFIFCIRVITFKIFINPIFFSIFLVIIL